MPKLTFPCLFGNHCLYTDRHTDSYNSSYRNKHLSYAYSYKSYYRYYTANNTESQQHFSSEQIQVDVDRIDNRPGNRMGVVSQLY